MRGVGVCAHRGQTRPAEVCALMFALPSPMGGRANRRARIVLMRRTVRGAVRAVVAVETWAAVYHVRRAMTHGGVG